MNTIKRCAVAVSLLVLCFAGTAEAGNFTTCFGTKAGNYFRTQATDGNVDSRMRNYNDYGMFFHDALNGGCNASTVATRLEQKIRNTPDSEWTVTFAGSPISVIMSTGLMLGARGALTEGLDTAIRDVGNKYQFIKDSTCGISGGKYANGNACLDDFTLAMTGYAWISAYKRLTGRAWEYERSQAVQQITNAFHPHEGTCIYNPDRALDVGTATNRGFCNGYNSDLGTTNAEILSINHGNQTPAYGVGLMTSVAAAFAGFDAAQKPIASHEWNSTQRLQMEWILVEGRRRSRTDGHFEGADAGARSCFDIVNGTLVKGIHCGDDFFNASFTDANGNTYYRANMNPVVPFYTRYGLSTTIDTTGFSYAAGSFAETFADAMDANYLDAWFGPFRRAVYKVMAGDWVYAYPSGRPRLTGRSEYKMTLGHFPSYWTMANGGGSTIDTTSTSTSDTRVRLILTDLSPLTPLQNGDAVSIRTPSGYYLTAVNGGGSSVNATSTTFNTVTNTFYVSKSNAAAGPIAQGDNINLKTYYGYYVVSSANSTSPPTAYSTSAGIGSPDFVKLEF
ncbi:MAG TPA: hypothetical protein VHK90_18135, partial [Thermoanaerobaculia bacterium]|nr:hypothetical protein [Thermoanaerobaculia bacterium]